MLSEHDVSSKHERDSSRDGLSVSWFHYKFQADVSPGEQLPDGSFFFFFFLKKQVLCRRSRMNV